MLAEVDIGGQTGPGGAVLTWSPMRAEVRLVDPGAVAGPVPVTVRARSTAAGGDLRFGSSVTSTKAADLSLALPVDGSPTPFYVAGRFGRPSSAAGDVAIEVVDAGSGAVLSSTAVMVRIRKNAVALSEAERSRFLVALNRINNKGAGTFAGLRLVHYEKGIREAHYQDGFLPWHRAYLLDLERQLQLIDSSVALPYWRFDQPAPRLFSQAFMGIPDPSNGTVVLSSDNPLQEWFTDGKVGFDRRPRFNTQTSPASGDFPVMSEALTLAKGELGDLFARFRTMEGSPHGAAHNSFNGYLTLLDMAVRDPLFFMLHAIVCGQSGSGSRTDSIQTASRRSRHRDTGARAATPGSAITSKTRCGRGTASPEASVRILPRADRCPDRRQRRHRVRRRRFVR
jgi:tyrosinase